MALKTTGTAMTILGVRGAFPVADRQFLEYGGNTSCIALRRGDRMLCLDAGSGFVGLCRQMEGVRRLDILIGHVHMDHVMGLFSLSACPCPEIHIYGEARQGLSFEQQLRRLTDKPYWPVDIGDMGDRIHIHQIEAGEAWDLPWGEDMIRVSTLRGYHPNGSILYQLAWAGQRIVYVVDCEMSPDMEKAIADFARGCSLLIWDANYVREDKHVGWGHSTWEEGLAMAQTAGVEQILMTHYSTFFTDEFVREQEALAKARYGFCQFAREGMVIAL